MPEELSVGTLAVDIGPLLAQYEQVTSASKQLNTLAVTNAQQQTQAFAQVTARLAEIATGSRAAATAQQQYSDDIAGLVREIRDQAAAQREAQRASAAAAAERRKANQEAREAARAEKAAAKEAAAAAKEVAAAERLRAKEEAAAAAQSEKAGGFFSNLLSKITGAKSGGEFFANLASSIGAAGAAVFAFNAIFSRIQQGLQDYSSLRGVQKTLEAVAGSAQAGGDEFAYIRQKSDELGLSLVPTAKAYAGLFAAAKEANISVATTRSVFEGVASAAKVLNLSAEDTNGVLLALQQIASKGTVASEELRGQIGERLPGAFGLAAKAVGLTTAELGKQLQAGKVLASDFLPKFAAQLKATYGDATADAAQEVGSNLGRINTFFAQSSARIGSFFAPLVAAIAAIITPSKTLLQVAESSAGAYYRQAEAAKGLSATITPLITRYEELNGTANRNAGQQRELDAIIQQLAKSVPGAVTEFDKYGKALGINGDAVRKFLADQRNLTEYNNRTALRDNSADLRRLVAEQQELQKQLNNTVPGADGLRRRQVAEASSGGTGGGGSFVRTLSQAESDKITRDYSAKLAKVQQDITANLQNRERLRGYNPLLPIDPTPTQLEGLIKKQEDIIKALKQRQKDATLKYSDGSGADFLLGPGGLDKQVDAAEKYLQVLLGKVDKTARTAASRLAAALAALAAARRELTTKALEAGVKESDDAGERARLNYEKQLRDIDLLAQKLRDKEAAVRRAGGRGANADGKLDSVQQGEVNLLKADAEKAYTKELERIERERAALLLGLQKDSDQKELDQLEAAFNEQVRLHVNEAGVLLALEAKYERDRQALLDTQATKRAQHEQKLSSSQADATSQVYGTGTQQSFYDAQFNARQQQLDSEKAFAEKRLNILKDNHSKEADEERAALAAQILRIRQQQIALNKEVEKSKFSIYRLVLGEKDGPEARAAVDKALSDVTATFKGALDQLNADQQQAAQQRAQDSTQRINELNAQIALEIQRNQDGSASNLEGLRNQLAEERAIRRQSIEDQRNAAKQKIIIDTIMQASAIASTIADIFAATAYLNVVPGVGFAIAAALSAAVIGAFVTSKVQAYQAAGNMGGSFFVGGEYPGGYTGDGNPREASTSQGPRPYEYHKREFIMNHGLTDTYRDSLFKPLHEGRPLDWSHPSLTKLLPDFSLPQKLREERQQHVTNINLQANAPLQAELVAVRGELAEIKATNAQMANQRNAIAVEGGYLIYHPPTGSSHFVKVTP